MRSGGKSYHTVKSEICAGDVAVFRCSPKASSCWRFCGFVRRRRLEPLVRAREYGRHEPNNKGDYGQYRPPNDDPLYRAERVINGTQVAIRIRLETIEGIATVASCCGTWIFELANRALHGTSVSRCMVRYGAKFIALLSADPSFLSSWQETRHQYRLSSVSLFGVGECFGCPSSRNNPHRP